MVKELPKRRHVQFLCPARSFQGESPEKANSNYRAYNSSLYSAGNWQSDGQHLQNIFWQRIGKKSCHHDSWITISWAKNNKFWWLYHQPHNSPPQPAPHKANKMKNVKYTEFWGKGEEYKGGLSVLVCIDQWEELWEKNQESRIYLWLWCLQRCTDPKASSLLICRGKSVLERPFLFLKLIRRFQNAEVDRVVKGKLS